MYIHYPIIGKHPEHLALIRAIKLIADTDDNVLIIGETGTGKELVADAIQQQSAQCQHPYFKLNCSAFSSKMINAEPFNHYLHQLPWNENNTLFGETKGGTLVLDEIEALPMSAQMGLLDFIEQNDGTSRIRVLAITTSNLLYLIKQGKFHKKLYSRLSTIKLQLQALRHRKSDIPMLLGYYLGAMAKRYGTTCPKVSKEVFDRLLAYHWPGNIRELRNICENVAARKLSYIDSIEDLPIKFDQLQTVPAVKCLSANLFEDPSFEQPCMLMNA